MAMIRPETEMRDAGIDWIGNIPKNWNIKPLYACLDEINQKNSPVVTTNILSLTNTDGVIPYSERGNQGIYSGKNLWSTGKMEAFGQRDGAHGPGIYRG